ncbi:uncharacterized protein VTP21DRAFT_10253 [Calcarisporiella thermophila]|uniref:uncharacterized protein n=1 Tax=Calcarisporiella thermophila TaxID=911321 RepID=UPI003742B3EB
MSSQDDHAGEVSLRAEMEILKSMLEEIKSKLEENRDEERDETSSESSGTAEDEPDELIYAAKAKHYQRIPQWMMDAFPQILDPIFSPEHKIRDRDLRAEWWARAPAIRDQVYDAPAMPSSLLQEASHQSKAKDRSLADFQSRLALSTRIIDALFLSVARFVENNRDVFPDTLCQYWLQLYRDITFQMRDHLATMSESRLAEIRQAGQYSASLRYTTPEHTLIPEEVAREFAKERRAASKSKVKTRKQRTSYRNSRKQSGIRSRS